MYVDGEVMPLSSLAKAFYDIDFPCLASMVCACPILDGRPNTYVTRTLKYCGR